MPILPNTSLTCDADAFPKKSRLVKTNRITAMKTTRLSFLLAFAILTPTLVLAEDPKPSPPPAEAPKVKPYPLDTCLVSGEKLGEMGKPLVFTHEGQEIKVCCKPCKPKFLKDPAKYLPKLTK